MYMTTFALGSKAKFKIKTKKYKIKPSHPFECDGYFYANLICVLFTFSEELRTDEKHCRKYRC